MARINFTRSTDYLAEQVAQPGDNPKRIGVVISASLRTAASTPARLEELARGALGKLRAAMARQMANLADENVRRSALLTYAGSLRLPAQEQVQLLEAGHLSELVTFAAAQQRMVPPEVQQFLVDRCFRHCSAMVALARNPRTHLATLFPLATHPDQKVRLALAAHLGPRMRIDEPKLHLAKQALYNELLHQFESDFVPYLVPVCRDPVQLEQMYFQSAKTPGVAYFFAENPFISDRVLLDISSSALMKLMPGGSTVANTAKRQLEKRLGSESEAAPQPF